MDLARGRRLGAVIAVYWLQSMWIQWPGVLSRGPHVRFGAELEPEGLYVQVHDEVLARGRVHEPPRAGARP